MRTDEHLVSEAERNISQALITIMGLKLRAGASPAELRAVVRTCVNAAIRSHKPAEAANGIDIYRVASILRTWHLDTQFLGPDGNPRPLKIRGKRGLMKLASHHFPPHRFEDVLSTLRRNGLVRQKRAGLWMPTERHARIPKPTAHLLSHFAEGVARLAETVAKNTSSRRKRDLLFERATKVSNLPISEARAFKGYVQTQGIAFLAAIDDWLETRSISQAHRHEKTCAAGVFTYAFIDEPNRSTGGKKKVR